MFNGEIEKCCVITSQNLGCQIQDQKKKKKKKGARFYRPPVILLRETQDIGIEHKVLCSNTVKKNELKTYISLKENKLVSFINS